MLQQQGGWGHQAVQECPREQHEWCPHHLRPQKSLCHHHKDQKTETYQHQYPQVNCQAGLKTEYCQVGEGKEKDQLVVCYDYSPEKVQLQTQYPKLLSSTLLNMPMQQCTYSNNLVIFHLLSLFLSSICRVHQHMRVLDNMLLGTLPGIQR